MNQKEPVQHDWAPIAITIFVHISYVEPFREIHIHLQRAALPITADGICQNKLQFGP